MTPSHCDINRLKTYKVIILHPPRTEGESQPQVRNSLINRSSRKWLNQPNSILPVRKVLDSITGILDLPILVGGAESDNIPSLTVWEISLRLTIPLLPLASLVDTEVGRLSRTSPSLSINSSMILPYSLMDRAMIDSETTWMIKECRTPFLLLLPPIELSLW